MLKPRDPSVKLPRIPVYAPPGARPRLSRQRRNRPRLGRPRRNLKLVWLSVLYYGVMFPATAMIVDHVGQGQAVWIQRLVAMWFVAVDGIIYAAAILIFKPNKP